jgi:hypothetical protein
MLSRALSSATVTLLIGCLVVIPVRAQNLEAGKSPSQIFAGTCNACHKSPRGLLRTVPAGSLPGFLRQHYTTSGDMASLLSAFLVANGAADTRHVGTPPKQAKDSDAKPAALPDQLDRFGRRLRPPAPVAQQAARPDAEPRQGAKPDADGLSPQAEPGRQGRNARRLARPGEAPDAARARLSTRGKPGEEPPKTEAVRTDAAKTDAVKPDPGKEEALKGEAVKGEASTSETAKGEAGRSEGTKPSGEGTSEAKIEAPKETGSGESPVLRADPVPPVTPAPAASPAASAAVSNGASEPLPEPPAPRVEPALPAVTASVPPPSPIVPAGPPAPPISQ